MRFRNIFLLIGVPIVMAALLFTDVDKGASTAIWLLGLSTGIIAAAFAHIARKGLFDYIDMGEFANKAKETSLGSSIVFLGMCIVIAALLGIFGKVM